MVERATYESRRRQLLDAVRTLREMPAQVVDALRAIAGEFVTLYRQRAELRDEAWQNRLTALIQQGEQRLDQLREQAETAYANAEVWVNDLANAYPLPDDPAERTALLTQYSVALARLSALLGFDTDADTASAVHRLRDSGQLARDWVLALACWLYAGEIAQLRGWSQTESALLSIERDLPEPVRSMVQLGREMAAGYARVQAGFAQAYAFVRQTGQMPAVIPAWRVEDGVYQVDRTSVQQLDALSAVHSAGPNRAP
jgi:hypothetical protein